MMVESMCRMVFPTFKSGLRESSRRFRQSLSWLWERSKDSIRGGNCDNALRV